MHLLISTKMERSYAPGREARRYRACRTVRRTWTLMGERMGTRVKGITRLITSQPQRRCFEQWLITSLGLVVAERARGLGEPGLKNEYFTTKSRPIEFLGRVVSSNPLSKQTRVRIAASARFFAIRVSSHHLELEAARKSGGPQGLRPVTRGSTLAGWLILLQFF